MLVDHPPRPRLTLNVGITGHRANVLPERILAALAAHVDAVFRDLRDATRRTAIAESAIFSNAAPLVRLHSPLATGADQLAANRARALGYHIRALLPFAPHDYRNDFGAGHEQEEYDRQLDAADEVFALPGERADEDEAYVLVGKAVVAAADVLVAIWDGRAGNGPGGTAHVVEHALNSSVPVIHLPVDRDTGAIGAPRLLIGGDLVEPVAEPIVDEAAYDRIVRDTLIPHTTLERDQLADYFAERERLTNWRIEYPLLLALLGVKSLPRWPWRQTSVAQDVIDERQGSEPIDPHGAQPAFDVAYAWANSLAVRYAQLFRSGHVTNYFLSAFAVILALSGLIVPQIKIYLVIGELATIGLLFLNTRAGTKGEWHRRWLQYRHLAESLRPLVYLKRTGLISTPFRSDFIHGPQHREAGADWTRWYAAAVWRDMASPRGAFGADEVRALAEEVLRDQIVPQARYHQVNAERMHRLDHRLHRIGNVLMGLVISACVLFLIGYGPLHEWVKSMTGPFIFITAGLPAVSAAVFGMRGHGEHLLAASRSANTATALDGNAARLRQVTRLEAIAGELESTAANMLADLNEWAVAYSERSLEIPG